MQKETNNALTLYIFLNNKGVKQLTSSRQHRTCKPCMEEIHQDYRPSIAILQCHFSLLALEAHTAAFLQYTFNTNNKRTEFYVRMYILFIGYEQSFEMSLQQNSIDMRARPNI
jgi:hypothetical protein